MSDYEPVSILMDDDNISEKRDISNKNEHTVPFWSINPNIILDTNYVFELFPTEIMTYNQKLNAITRLVFVVTIICFAFTRNVRVLFIFAITIFAIFLIYRHNSKNEKKDKHLEGFGNLSLDILSALDKPANYEVFDKPTPENPFSNVLMNDYDYNPNKKPAPQIDKPEISNNILNDAKIMVQNLNPGQPNIADKLFRDLGEQYVFEQSLRPFYSTASTTIPNDQSGFADFCYGSMISCKEGNLFACAKNNSLKHINQ